ncbi:hypothetical protein ESCO_005044 [Escovopsis weberi]|uniref:1,3-beta-glucanosyltransferase n=1 Tax=Escovopsis weberi TaxID=150374 RepID=A0A0M8MY25_ESCWE|nr:hypothetical protein ESCO_005044 [Escovopsis weberi]
MKGLAYISTLAAIGAVSANPTAVEKEPPSKRASLPAVTISGNAFWAGKDRFYLRGLDYQPGGAAANLDPLADPDICQRDIQHFKDLGINTIRVYAVDNSKDHDTCMNALADAGIYVVADVNNPKYSINRIDPGPSYNPTYLQSVFATVEMLAKYPNTLAFFSGNEVINDETGTDAAAPYVKATKRDMTNYMKARGLRLVPVGYSAADVSSNRMQTAQYMNCGDDDDARSDFFAFNDYSWCNSDFVTSGWDQKVKNFTDYGLPIFLSEWGCNINRPRKFDEFSALMSSNMSAVYSGGLLYEYSNETNDYGIVSIKGDKVTELDEYGLFKKALADNPSPTGDGGASKTTHAVACPTSDTAWKVDPSALPAMPALAEQFFKSGAQGGPGLNGSGSQTAGDGAVATTFLASPTSTGGKQSGASSLGWHDKSPLAVAGLTLVCALFGTLLV